MTYNVFSGTLNPTQSVNQSTPPNLPPGNSYSANNQLSAGKKHRSPKFLEWSAAVSRLWLRPIGIGMT